jgi:hypothetical protein
MGSEMRIEDTGRPGSPGADRISLFYLMEEATVVRGVAPGTSAASPRPESIKSPHQLLLPAVPPPEYSARRAPRGERAECPSEDLVAPGSA